MISNNSQKTISFSCMPRNTRSELLAILTDPQYLCPNFKAKELQKDAMTDIYTLLGETFTKSTLTALLLPTIVLHVTGITQTKLLINAVFDTLASIDTNIRLTQGDAMQLVKLSFLEITIPILIETGDAPLTRSQIEGVLLKYGVNNRFLGDVGFTDYSCDDGSALAARATSTLIDKNSEALMMISDQNLHYA